MKSICIILGVLLTLGVGLDHSLAQRGRGGIRGGGGVSRPTPSMPKARPPVTMGSTAKLGSTSSLGGTRASSLNHSPSLSRAGGPKTSPNIGRTTSSDRFGGANGLTNSGNWPGGSLNASNRPIASADGRRLTNPTGNSPFGKVGLPQGSALTGKTPPSRGELSDFLSLGSTNSTDRSRPSTLPGSSGDSGLQGGKKTITTENGTTITVGGAAGGGKTDGGVVGGGAVGGVKVETDSGNTFVKGRGAAGVTDGERSAIAAGSAAGVETADGRRAGGARGVQAATDGDNVAIRGGGVAAGRDAEGNRGLVAQGGYADSNGTRRSASVAARQNANGYARVNVTSSSRNNGVGTIKSSTTVVGPRGNAVTAGRGAAFVNGQFVGGTSWTRINGSYSRWHYFGPNYAVNYPRCWWPGKWAVAATAWSFYAYSVTGAYCGCAGPAVYYDYGQTITYQGNNVYVGDEPVATDEQFYVEARQLAQSGLQTENDEWLPLGVFGFIAQAEQESTERVVQLAINKDGVIRGNLHDLLTDQVIPVYGALDRESQRLAIMLENNPDLVVESGLYNLTNDECPILVHYSASERADKMLVRLHEPSTDAATE